VGPGQSPGLAWPWVIPNSDWYKAWLLAKAPLETDAAFLVAQNHDVANAATDHAVTGANEADVFLLGAGLTLCSARRG